MCIQTFITNGGPSEHPTSTGPYALCARPSSRLASPEVHAEDCAGDQQTEENQVVSTLALRCQESEEEVSDLNPSAGFSTIEEEFEAQTAKAFRAGADYIILNSRRQRFQAEAAQYCQDRGWLTEPEWLESYEAQYGEYRYRLTDAGRAHWGIASKAA